MEMQISNASEFPLYHSMAAGPHPFQIPGGIPPVSTIPSYKNTMFPDRLGFYYDAAGAAAQQPPERCDRCYVELAVGLQLHHFGKKLCGMCAAKEQQQQQASPKVEAEILDLDSQQVMSQQRQRQQQQQQQQQEHPVNKGFLQHGGGAPPGYDGRAQPPPPPPPPPPTVALDWPGYFQPQQNTLSGEHLSPDYNNVTTTTTTPPTMMGGSPPSDMQQQQQYQGNFDGGGYAVDSNQQSSGGGGGGSGSKGNGSWKSNEARRAKTYECPACDKWFTSSGHLKRHYGTQLHKNAVKQSGKPDPALLPMKHHYHPYRDPAYVAQQKIKQQNGGVPPSMQQQQQQQHCGKQQMQADFRPVTSSTSSFLHTDSFLELTPPNLTASLSDSLGGTHYLPPARRPVSNSSSSNSNCSTAAGFTDAMQTSSYISSSSSSNNNNNISNSNNISYPGDRTAHLPRPPATLYHDPNPLMALAAVHRARSAYRRHPTTTTTISTTNTTPATITTPGTIIPPYTTQVSTTRPATNTDSYTTTPANNDDPFFHFHYGQQLQHQPPQHQPPPSHYPYSLADYQPPSSCSTSPYSPQPQPSPYSSPPPPYPSHHRRSYMQWHKLQAALRPTDDGGGGDGGFCVKAEPVDEYASPDTPLASPDSSCHDHVQQQQFQSQQHQQQNNHHHHHHRYSGLLVVAPMPPPAQSSLSPPPPNLVIDEDADGASDCSSTDEAPASPALPPPQQQQQQQPCNKKCRKATRVTCEPCNKEFTDKCYKTQHDQRFHSGEKPFRCGVCGKRFGELRQLEHHELRHNNVNKAFPCTVCTKSFNFKNDLERHFISNHSAEKPYQCVRCSKKFVRLDHKRHHERTHGDGVTSAKKPRKKQPPKTAVSPERAQADDGGC